MNTQLVRFSFVISLGFAALGGCASSGATESRIVHCPGEHLALEQDGEHHGIFVSPHEGVEGLTTTKLAGERGYAVAYRHDDGIAVGAMTPDHSPIGGLVALSRAHDPSQPIIAADGEGVLVAWSERAGNNEPWHVRLVRWIPGVGAKSLDDQVTPTRDDSPPNLEWSRDASGVAIVRVQSDYALAGL